MKNLKIVMLAILTLSIASCSKNDDQEPSQPTTQELLISGKWYIESMGNQPLSNCEKETYFHFVNASEVLLEEFSFDGEFCISGGIGSFNYTLSNSDIEIIFGNFPQVYSIQSISNTELVLKIQGGGQDTNLVFTK